jgi:hypothetical protein
MSKGVQVKAKIPILYYEESGPNEPANPIPYIECDQGEEMPVALFVQEYRHTGETEPDEEGNPRPIVDMFMHKYIDLDFLKGKLSPELNDQVRVAIGLKPLEQAQKEGQVILDKVFAKQEK